MTGHRCGPRKHHETKLKIFKLVICFDLRISRMCNLLFADVVQEGSNKKSISLSDIWDMLNKISVKLDKHIADSEVRFGELVGTSRLEEPISTPPP
jgi:hypothetical protein